MKLRKFYGKTANVNNNENEQQAAPAFANENEQQADNRITGRGGKRKGAGRPKGTTGKYKDVVKKMFTFRLSVEEEKAVRDLLKKMRGK